MAVYTRGICTITSVEGIPITWILFDPRCRSIAADSAGGYYQRLRDMATRARVDSSLRFRVDINEIPEGVVRVIENQAVKTNYDGEKLINSIVDFINNPTETT